MKFINIGDKYYNTALIGWIGTSQINGETRYFVQFVGGLQLEITEEQYNELLSNS